MRSRQGGPRRFRKPVGGERIFPYHVAMTLDVQLRRISADDMPHFRFFSQTIHLPFPETDLLHHAEALATLVHEYTHLLQATTTVVGVYNFRGLARRLSQMLSALSFQPDLAVPVERWPAPVPQLERVKSFLEFEDVFRFNFAMAMGSWTPRDADGASELELREVEFDIEGKVISRWHVARACNGRLKWIPLMPYVLCEGQAEAYAQCITGQNSKIWAGIGAERDLGQLAYTTVPALLQKHLPGLRTDGVAALLVDFAMMSFKPDSAFVKALGWLKELMSKGEISGSPDWNELRRRVDGRFTAHSRSIDRIEADIHEAIEIYSQRDDPVSTMILFRLNQSASAMRARRHDPGVFLPIGYERQTTIDRLQSIIPIPRAEFLDGFHSLGPVEAQHLSSQSMLSSASHLLRVVCEGEDARCPFFEGPCTHERTLDCAASPWHRGDVGGGRFCEYGRVGGLLGFHHFADLDRLKAELRESAHKRWVSRGRPTGDDWADWFAAREQMGIPNDFVV